MELVVVQSILNKILNVYIAKMLDKIGQTMMNQAILCQSGIANTMVKMWLTHCQLYKILNQR